MQRDTGWRLFLRTVIARAYPRVIGQQREKAWIFFETFLPFLGTLGYVYVYKAIGGDTPQTNMFIGFVVMGGAMTAFWLNVMWSMSSQLYWEKEQGNLALYIMAPNSLMAILLGMAVGGLLATCLRAGVIIVANLLLFQIPFNVTDWPQLALVFVLTMTALYGLGMMFASVFLLWGREAWQIVTALQEPVYFFSGFYFPVNSFGVVGAWLASVIPLTLGLDAMRQLAFAVEARYIFLPVQWEIALLAGLAVLFLAGARFWLRVMERQAIAEGRLTDRRR